MAATEFFEPVRGYQPQRNEVESWLTAGPKFPNNHHARTPKKRHGRLIKKKRERRIIRSRPASKNFGQWLIRYVQCYNLIFVISSEGQMTTPSRTYLR
jgi:hypothetical protein